MKRNFYLRKCTGIALILAMIAGLLPAETTMAAKKVAISKKAITLTAGKKTTLKLKNIKKSQKKKVKWTSSKKSVAAVNQSGKVTAKKKGIAKITAKYAGKKYTCKVTVKAKAVKKPKPTDERNSESNASSTDKPNAVPTAKPSGKLNKTSLSIDLTQTCQLSLSGAIAKKWNSSDEKMATVVDGLVTPHRSGVVTITCEDTQGFVYSCKINIVYPDIKLVPNKIYKRTIGRENFYSMDFLVANNCGYDIFFGGKEPWTDVESTVAFYYKYGYDDMTAAFMLIETAPFDISQGANPTIKCRKNEVSTVYAFQGKTLYTPVASSEFMWAITINGIKYSVLTDFYGDIIAMVSWGHSDI